MRVLRMECSACPSNHGPVWSGHTLSLSEWEEKYGYETDFWYRPAYGSIRETPTSDPLLNCIYDEERVGTLPDQFDRWWSAVETKLRDPWVVSVYEVDNPRVGNNQVLFDPSRASRLYSSNWIDSALSFVKEEEPVVAESAYTNKYVSVNVTDVRERTAMISLGDVIDMYDLRNGGFDTLVVEFHWLDVNGREKSRKIRLNVADLAY